MDRPYTTPEMLEKIGVKHRSYINVVIFNAKRSTPHPLADAKLARGMWDKDKVDQYAKDKASTY
jgi:hypothetical protein